MLTYTLKSQSITPNCPLQFRPIFCHVIFLLVGSAGVARSALISYVAVKYFGSTDQAVFTHRSLVRKENFCFLCISMTPVHEIVIILFSSLKLVMLTK